MVAWANTLQACPPSSHPPTQRNVGSATGEYLAGTGDPHILPVERLGLSRRPRASPGRGRGVLGEPACH